MGQIIILNLLFTFLQFLSAVGAGCDGVGASSAVPVPGVGWPAASASPGVGRPHPQPGGGRLPARLRPQLRRLPGRAGGQPAPEEAGWHGHAHRHCVQVNARLFQEVWMVQAVGEGDRDGKGNGDEEEDGDV